MLISLPSQALFARAKELGVQISAGYAEKTSEGLHYNTCSYVADGKELSKVRRALNDVVDLELTLPLSQYRKVCPVFRPQ